MSGIKKRPLPKSINICLVASHFAVAGRSIENGFLGPVARELVRLGHSVTVLTWGEKEPYHSLSQDGIEIYFVGQGRGLSFQAFPRLVKEKFKSLHDKKPFDVVHAMDSGALDLGASKEDYKVALVYDVEATQMSQIYSIIGMAQETVSSLLSTAINVSYKFISTYLGRDRKLLKQADAVCVTSLSQKNSLERYYLYPERKTHLIPYGIELGDISPREKSLELRQKIGLPENGHVVVTVTDMTELAQTIHLLRAFETVVVKRPSSRLIVVGNGPMFKKIEFEALCLALGSKVIFTGSIPQEMLPEYISLADIYVSLGAHASGFEPVTLEAMAQKKLVVGSEVSPMSVLIEDGIDGFLIRPADVATLSALLQQVFSGEIDATSIGERAREKVLKLFDLKRMVDQTLLAYTAAMKGSGFFR